MLISVKSKKGHLSMIDFKKNDKGVEEATISKADYDKAIADAVAEAKKPADEKQVVEEKKPSNLEVSPEDLRAMKKELRMLREKDHRADVFNEYVKQGGKKDYFNEFYGSNRFDESTDLSKDMADIRAKKSLFFENKQNFSFDPKDLGLDVETPSPIEELKDANGLIKVGK